VVVYNTKITFGGTPQRQKLSMSRSKVSDPKMVNIKWSTVSFLFLVRFLLPCQAKTARPILIIYTSNEAVSSKEMTFGVLTPSKTSNGFLRLKYPKIWTVMGIFGLNNCMNNLSTVHTISAQIS
jgi:hypothetical protein